MVCFSVSGTHKASAAIFFFLSWRRQIFFCSGNFVCVLDATEQKICCALHDERIRPLQTDLCMSCVLLLPDDTRTDCSHLKLRKKKAASSAQDTLTEQ